MNAALELWQRQARRINALTLRERAIMFVSLAAALVATADALVLSPRLNEQKSALARMRQQRSELEAMRATLSGSGPEADTPAARLGRQLAQTRTEQRGVDDEIARRSASAGDGARLADVLERVLQRHPRLTLLHLTTLDAAPARPPATLPPQPGIELSLRGSYPDLAQYVADTERALPALRWGELSIASSGAAPVLTARVYLPGEQR